MYWVRPKLSTLPAASSTRPRSFVHSSIPTWLIPSVRAAVQLRRQRLESRREGVLASGFVVGRLESKRPTNQPARVATWVGPGSCQPLVFGWLRQLNRRWSVRPSWKGCDGRYPDGGWSSPWRAHRSAEALSFSAAGEEIGRLWDSVWLSSSRGGRAVLGAIGRSVRELWRKLTRQITSVSGRAGGQAERTRQETQLWDQQHHTPPPGGPP